MNGGDRQDAGAVEPDFDHGAFAQVLLVVEAYDACTGALVPSA